MRPLQITSSLAFALSLCLSGCDEASVTIERGGGGSGTVSSGPASAQTASAQSVSGGSDEGTAGINIGDLNTGTSSAGGGDAPSEGSSRSGSNAEPVEGTTSLGPQSACLSYAEAYIACMAVFSATMDFETPVQSASVMCEDPAALGSVDTYLCLADVYAGIDCTNLEEVLASEQVTAACLEGGTEETGVVEPSEADAVVVPDDGLYACEMYVETVGQCHAASGGDPLDAVQNSWFCEEYGTPSMSAFFWCATDAVNEMNCWSIEDWDSELAQATSHCEGLAEGDHHDDDHGHDHDHEGESEDWSDEEAAEGESWSTDADDDEGAWGATCFDDSWCYGAADMCIKQPGATQGYCSAPCPNLGSDCSYADWTCNVIGTCDAPAASWCGPPEEIEESDGFVIACE